MSIDTAVRKLALTLKLDDLPYPVVDIPDEVMELGPRPSFFIEDAEESFQYGALIAAYPTRTSSLVRGIVTVHLDNVPQGLTLKQYLRDIGKRIREKLEADTVAGVYQEDGDKGFRVELQNISYYIRPTDPVAAVMLKIAVSQYQ